MQSFCNYLGILARFLPVLWLFGLGSIALAQDFDEEFAFETAKKNILCKTAQFLINQQNNNNNQVAVDCQDLKSLETTIPERFKDALWLVRRFKDKRYETYGKGKLEARLDKLTTDLTNDLRKNKKNPPNWEEGFKTLQADWRKLRDEVLPNGTATTKNQATEEDKNVAANKDNAATQADNDSNSSPKSSMLIYFILLAMMGGIGFLVYQNLQLKQQMMLLEEDLQERYSRLDNRIDAMTPLKEFKSLSLKLVQTNDQLSTLMQEVINLQVKTSDEERLSPEEIYAQRTAHLESQYSADVQIYYAKPYENSHYFLPHDFRTEPTRENFFKIEMHLDDAQQVFYRIVDRSEYQNLPLTQLDTTLKPYVELMNHLNNPTRILTLEPGVLEKKNNAWVITKKAKVLLE
ncbi:MAG TPA: hypothetical protein DCM08_13205 [Microscillaceae bacterium]|jgi:cell division protein FtsB|nr:hypothetical protein [Microscillaceae bacterium]